MAASTISSSRLRSIDVDQARYISRWTTMWIVLLTVVVIVVVLFLIFITNSLATINGNLGITSNAVTGAGGHVQTLPAQVQNVNTSLTGIDSSLKPISGEAAQIITALTSVNNSLGGINSSLVSTSSSLLNTSSSLTNTSSILEAILTNAGNINATLNAANIPAGNCTTTCSPSQVGVQNIYQRVALANTPLISAQTDTSAVASNLVPKIDSQLHGICTGGLVQLVAVLNRASC